MRISAMKTIVTGGLVGVSKRVGSKIKSIKKNENKKSNN